MTSDCLKYPITCVNWKGNSHKKIDKHIHTWTDSGYRLDNWSICFSVSNMVLSTNTPPRSVLRSSFIDRTLTTVCTTRFALFSPCNDCSSFVGPFSSPFLCIRICHSSLGPILPEFFVTTRLTQVAQRLHVQAEVAVPVTVPFSTI